MKILFIKSILIKSILRFACFILLFPLTSQITAQNKLPFNFAISTWTQDEGLPQNSINDIVQTKDGYIWFATFSGLARFNGVKFTVFNTFNSPGLVSDRIIGLFEDNNGGLWISAERGLSYYKNGSFKTFTSDDGFLTNSGVYTRQDKKGVVWLFAFPEIYRFLDGRFYKQEIIYDENLRSRAYNGDADFFVPFKNNIYAVVENKVIDFITNDKHPGSYFWSAIEYPKGTIWASTNSYGLYKFSRDGVQRYTTDDGLLSNHLGHLYLDSEGAIWVTGPRGLNYILNNKIYSITRGQGIPDSDNKVLIQDHEGNYWIGTSTKGIFQLRKTIISNYSEKDGLRNDQILSISNRSDGGLLIGTNGGGLYELRNNKITYSPLNKSIKEKFIWSIFEDSQKRVWCSDSDLFYIDEMGKAVYTTSGEFYLYNTQAIYEDKTGAIWVGYRFGLLRYYNNKFERYSTEQGLSDNDVRCIYEDDKGNIWAGTVNGLNKISKGKVEAFANIPGLRNQYIRAIHQDSDGVLWFGTYGGGLLRYKNNKFFVFTTENGMHDNVISNIVEDHNGYFWMGGNRGIQRVKRQQLSDYADGKISSYFVYNYDKSDGMISVETNGGFQPSAVEDKNGNIYFPTIKGLSVVHTKELQINNKVPPVYIENVLVDGKSRDFTDLHVSYDSSNIEIEYNVLCFTAPEKTHSKYIMEGYDNGWNNTVNLRYARYTNLPPGEYTFKVIASNNDNVWNEQGASIPITVLPPFWMTWWFRSILIILFLSIGPIIYYRRIRALKAEQVRQHKFSEKLINSQEHERSRIAQELHDSLGQELLLIKNRAMLGLKSLAGDSKTKQQLEYISDYSVNAINLVRRISHNLRPPELDRLGLTETLRSVVNEIKDLNVVNIKSTVEDIDGLIEKRKEINLLRIVQEAVANILKHAGATEIIINVSSKDGTVNVFIADNGKGFNQETDSYVATRGLGFSGMKERTKILDGSFTVDSSPGNGTKINIGIPIKHERNS